MTQSGTSYYSRQTYFPYGAQRTTEGSALPTDYTFTGQKNDDSTGLMFYGARYYDATLGRFTQPDTIVPHPLNPQSLNRFSYALNNPVRYMDPTGHVACEGENECGSSGGGGTDEPAEEENDENTDCAANDTDCDGMADGQQSDPPADTGANQYPNGKECWPRCNRYDALDALEEDGGLSSATFGTSTQFRGKCPGYCSPPADSPADYGGAGGPGGPGAGGAGAAGAGLGVALTQALQSNLSHLVQTLQSRSWQLLREMGNRVTIVGSRTDVTKVSQILPEAEVFVPPPGADEALIEFTNSSFAYNAMRSGQTILQATDPVKWQTFLNGIEKTSYYFKELQWTEGYANNLPFWHIVESLK